MFANSATKKFKFSHLTVYPSLSSAKTVKSSTTPLSSHSSSTDSLSDDEQDVFVPPNLRYTTFATLGYIMVLALITILI